MMGHGERQQGRISHPCRAASARRVHSAGKDKLVRPPLPVLQLQNQGPGADCADQKAGYHPRGLHPGEVRRAPRRPARDPARDRNRCHRDGSGPLPGGHRPPVGDQAGTRQAAPGKERADRPVRGAVQRLHQGLQLHPVRHPRRQRGIAGRGRGLCPPAVRLFRGRPGVDPAPDERHGQGGGHLLPPHERGRALHDCGPRGRDVRRRADRARPGRIVPRHRQGADRQADPAQETRPDQGRGQHRPAALGAGGQAAARRGRLSQGRGPHRGPAPRAHGRLGLSLRPQGRCHRPHGPHRGRGRRLRQPLQPRGPHGVPDPLPGALLHVRPAKGRVRRGNPGPVHPLPGRLSPRHGGGAEQRRDRHGHGREPQEPAQSERHALRPGGPQERSPDRGSGRRAGPARGEIHPAGPALPGGTQLPLAPVAHHLLRGPRVGCFGQRGCGGPIPWTAGG